MMKIKTIKYIANSKDWNGVFTDKLLIKTNEFITIKKGRFYELECKNSILEFDRQYLFENNFKYVYFLYKGGNKKQHHYDEIKKIDIESENTSGYFIVLNWFQSQKFLWMQRKHWLQKESNIRYIINILYLTLGCFLAYKQIK